MAKENLTIEQKISAWKEQYGGVFLFEVEDKTVYLKEPTIQDFKRAFTAMQNDGEIGFGEEMLGALWLEGDEEIRKDDYYFLAARKDLAKLINYDEPTLVELPNRGHQIWIGENVVEVRVITREDLRIAEKKNPAGKVFVTQERLFEMIAVNPSEIFLDKNNAAIRFPLYQAIERIQNKKITSLKKL